jgi:hypothetical protein
MNKQATFAPDVAAAGVFHAAHAQSPVSRHRVADGGDHRQARLARRAAPNPLPSERATAAARAQCFASSSNTSWGNS